MKTDLLRRLTERPILCDGGMGTQLFEAGLPPGEPGELWNLQRRDAIQAIHRAYRDAGCRLLTTNTFGGCVEALARHHLAEQADPINEAAASLAREVAGPDAWVLADIGPFGGFLEPIGDSLPDDVEAMFHRQAEALHRGGADIVVVETMVDPAEAVLAIRAARDVADWPIIATFAFNRAGDAFRTVMGAEIRRCMADAIDAGAAVVGANCGTNLSLEDYRELAEQVVYAAEGQPVIIQPNAGPPRHTGTGVRYDVEPRQMAELTRSLLDTGVRIVGGCCGTTPRHLAAMAQAMDQWSEEHG